MAVTAKKKKSRKSVNLQPLGARLVVARDDADETTAGGILLPSSAQEKPTFGTVLSTGEGRLLKDGSRAEMQVKEGDKILFASYGPDEIKVGEDTFLLLHEDDVLAVIE
ncbi:MAG: co-chaperone GroES [Planctomycetota bacterium]